MKSRIEGHWRWILMLGILAVGLPLLAWLLVWLKRRHRRRLEEQRAAASGFPTEDGKRMGARAVTPELWGPHQVMKMSEITFVIMLTPSFQHMHYTKGWEYHNDPAIVGVGANASSSSKRDRRLQRQSSSQYDQRDQPEMAEYGGSRRSSRPPASRRESSKGKTRAIDEITPVDSRGSHVNPADRSRSRSQRRRDPNDDVERTVSDTQHERRLREVRGSQRKKDDQR